MLGKGLHEALADLSFEVSEPELPSVASWVSCGLTAYDAAYWRWPRGGNWRSLPTTTRSSSSALESVVHLLEDQLQLAEVAPYGV
ncbi:MAG: hypothetical protein M0005_01235 [Actinomycetota bacterium]|nr:hypothetical protein [Actinomycetota bacterium]